MQPEQSIFVKLGLLTQSDPVKALEIIEELVVEDSELETNSAFLLLRSEANLKVGTGPVIQGVMQDRPLDFRPMSGREIRSKFALYDQHLDHLERGLTDIRTAKSYDDRFLEKLGSGRRKFEFDLDAAAMILERCRPGKSFECLGEFKLKYLEPSRVKVATEINHRVFQPFMDIPIMSDYAVGVKSAMVMEYLTHDDGRRYIQLMLFDDIIDSDSLESSDPADWLNVFDDREVTSLF